MQQGPPTLKELVIAVGAAAAIATIFLALYAILSTLGWYQEMGEFFHEYPIVLAAIIGAFFAMEIGLVVYLRRRYPEDY